MHVAKHVCHTGAYIHRVTSIVERRTAEEAVSAISGSLRSPVPVMTLDAFKRAHGSL